MVSQSSPPRGTSSARGDGTDVCPVARRRLRDHRQPIGNAVVALLDTGQWKSCGPTPALAAAAVEETLRFDSPVQRTGRVALHDMEIAGSSSARTSSW